MLRRGRASYPRRRFRARRRAWFTRNWVRLLVGSLFFIVPALASSLWLHGYLLGLLQAGLLGVFAVAITSSFFAHTQAVGQMAGAWGEDFTRDELRKAKRRGLIWGSVDGVATSSGDIDHLVITRHAGVVVIDSKWRNDPDRETLIRDAAAATAAARRARLVLRSIRQPAPVIPVVAVWGAGRRTVPASARVDEVEFIDGGHLVRWLRSLPAAPIDRQTGQQVLRDLSSFKQRVQPELNPRT